MDRSSSNQPFLLLQSTGMVSTSRAAFRLLTTLSCGYHHSRPVCTRVRHVHPWLAAQLSQDNALHESSGPSSLAELPDFRGPSRLLTDAYKKSKELTPNYKIGNQKKRITKFATQRIDAYASSISVAMRDQLKAYREVSPWPMPSGYQKVQPRARDADPRPQPDHRV